MHHKNVFLFTQPLLRDELLNVARVHNSVCALSRVYLSINPDTISQVYQRSLDEKLEPFEMIQPENINLITQDIRQIV
jgi:hypothetical protein